MASIAPIEPTTSLRLEPLKYLFQFAQPFAVLYVGLTDRGLTEDG